MQQQAAGCSLAHGAIAPALKHEPGVIHCTQKPFG
jgi:hypothetical protein